IARAPYENSYHGIQMDFESLQWKINEPILKLTNILGSTKKDALFTSTNFFKKDVYDKIGGMSPVNPLYSIYKMVEGKNSTTLSVTELGYYLNIAHTAAQNMVTRFSSMGFMSFNFDKDEFYVNQKLIDYVRAAGKQ